MSAPPTRKKGLQIGRALKSAAKLPVRAVSAGKGSGRNAFSPVPGETPIIILRVRILSCTDLTAKDRNGFSDPFVVVALLNSRFQTPAIKRSTNPVYQPKDATFDFPIHLSLADRLGALELVIWDKDMLGKDYLGEVAIPLDNWFPKDPTAESTKQCFGFNHPQNEPISLDLVSTRSNTPAKGTIQVKIGFVAPPNTHLLSDFSEVYNELVKRSRPSFVSAPPTEGLGTVRSIEGGPAYEDDGGLSSDESETADEEDDEFFSAPEQPKSGAALAPPAQPQLTTVSMPVTPVGTPKPSSILPRIRLPRRISSGSTKEASQLSAPQTPALGATPTEKKKFRQSWTGGHGTRSKREYHLSAENDIVGIVMLEINKAEDLPKLKNMTRTGWDMDPCVVISFGKKVFRTRVIRHSLNPIWDEKLIFHVRRYETSFKVQFTVLDWDKLSSNDHVGDASMDVKELLQCAPQPDPNTGLYASDDDGAHAMRAFQLPLSTAKEMPWEAKHNPLIHFRAKFQPYDALRQHFWRQYLKQYDTDDSETINHLELTSMLDSLGSTLTRATTNSFFTRFDKSPHEDALTFDEVVTCLETEIGRPDSEKRRIEEDDGAPDSSLSATPILSVADGKGAELPLDQIDFSGPPMIPSSEDSQRLADAGHPARITPTITESNSQPLSAAAVARPDTSDSDMASDSNDPSTTKSRTGKSRFKRKNKRTRNGSDKSASDSSGSVGSVERVINVKNCPLCHRPRMNSRAEVDIITHLAVCASQDWAKVDRIVVGNFVTANQAQRKWYTKIISKVSSGDYKLGANSANIIVQNRMTGQLEEEKMQVYVRLGIRLLYKGAKSRMESSKARGLLKSLSIKQGIKYDAPESAADIPAFIQFHNLTVDEILDPISSFKSFNEFFYRKLKPEARPVEDVDDPYRVVSAADCRLMAFETVEEATTIWIKGREFTVAKLLGDTYRSEVDRYTGGALVIFRLAPQDYHRFHTPVDGKIGKMTYISGEYYTVNPQAIRTTLDVYGDNCRKIVPIDSPQFGRVMAVCIGAMMVGTIKTTVEEGQEVKRGDEFGYFAFGGSTIVMLFEKGTVEWDEDLLINGRASLETLVRVGMGIGRGRKN